MSLVQKMLLPIVLIGFIYINARIYDDNTFYGLEWFTFALYLTQIATQLLLVVSFNQREKKIDELENSKVDLDTFKKIVNNIQKPIWVVDYLSHKMIYSNDNYNLCYGNYMGERIDDNWNEVQSDIFLFNNDIAKKAQGKVLVFKEPTKDGKTKEFYKFLSIMNGKEVIIGIEKF